MKKYLICILWASVCLSLNVQAQEAKKKKLSAREQLINEYYMMADSCLKCDNYSDAITYATRGVGEIKNIKKSKDLYYDLKMIEAMSYMSLRDFTTALSVLCTLENLSLGPWHIAKLYYNKSACYEELKDWSQSLLNYEKCLNIIENWDDAAELILRVKLGVARIYALSGQYNISNDFYEDIVEYVKQNFDKETYLECCDEICNSFYSIWYSPLYLEAISEIQSFYEENNIIDEGYCSILLEKGMIAHHLSQFQLAYDTFRKMIEISCDLEIRNYNVEYISYLRLASSTSRLKKYTEALTYLDKAEEYIVKGYVNDVSLKEDLFFTRAVIMIDEGKKTKEAAGILNTLLDSNFTNQDSTTRPIIYYNLGHALEVHDSDAALEAYQRALPLLAEHFSDGVILAKALNRAASLLANKNENKVAIQYFETAIDIFRKCSSIDNYSFVTTLCNAAECAYQIGEYGRSISWAEEARKLQNTTSVGCVDFSAWDILLNSYSIVNNRDAYDDVREEYKTHSQNGLLDYGFARREIVRMYKKGDVEAAIEYVNTIDSLNNSSNFLESHNVSIEDFITPKYNYRFDYCMKTWQTRRYEWSLFDFALHLLDCGEDDSAHTILKSIYDIAKVDTEYLVESCFVSSTCEDLHNLRKIINCCAETFRNQLKVVIGMSSSEKEEYWREMSYLKNVVGYFRNEIPISKQLFDISLIYKNFLINSDVTFLRTLEQKGNKKQKQLASELRHTKDLLSTVETHNYNVDSLKIREIEINRQIIQNLTNLSDFEYTSNRCCDSIATALLHNEVAIEIADYSTNDSKSYVAMILRKDWQEPVLVELGDESKFLSLSNKPVKKLYDPTLPFSTELYELIWAPLTPYLNKSDIIYISPSGIISTLAIEALSSEDGVYVSDIYDIKRVSSAAYILERENEYKYTSSCVFGGVQYDSNVKTNYSTGNCTWDSGYLLDRSVYEDIPYLPGTKKEAEMISAILANSKNDVSLHIGLEANEYAFKNLSGNASQIIHIATHGFYIPKKEINSYRYYGDNKAGLAMERSGLMLAGANDAWNGILTPGVEDGILTASEIAELDLSKTSLVVMSACETGLGEVTEDGIEGLQRAFKSAGVETLVMSLWKVDDKATEMLMEEFYKLVLKGYSKDDAFQTAKTKVRSKKSYSSPYYWASFIMLD